MIAAIQHGFGFLSSTALAWWSWCNIYHLVSNYQMGKCSQVWNDATSHDTHHCRYFTFHGIHHLQSRLLSPCFILSSTITLIGADIFVTFTPNTSHAEWIGSQVIYGIKLGLGTQHPLMVVQTFLSRSDISTGSAFVMFMRFMGSAIFLAVAQIVFLPSCFQKRQRILPVSAPIP